MMRAAVTLRKTEKPFFLPLWERYYGPHFDRLIVIDGLPESTDFWVQNNAWRDLVNEQLVRIRAKYQTILLADLDEFVVPDPEKYSDLGDYLNQVKLAVIQVNGYNVIEVPGDEMLDPGQKITEQRGMWQKDDMYDKPMISRIPIRYSRGFHRCNKPAFRDEDLVLFHLRDAYVTGSALFSRLEYTGAALEYRRSQAVAIPEKWRVI